MHAWLFAGAPAEWPGGGEGIRSVPADLGTG